MSGETKISFLAEKNLFFYKKKKGAHIMNNLNCMLMIMLTMHRMRSVHGDGERVLCTRG